MAKLQIGYNNGENPFVAAQRFIDAYMLPQYHLNEIADYIQQRVGKGGPTLGEGGRAAAASSAKPAATAGIPIVAFQYLPMPGYKSFDLPSKTALTTLEKMKSKIQEFGKLSDSQLAVVSTLMETLVATNRYHASSVNPEELNLISEMLNIFPPAEVFPALDLARLTILHPDAASAAKSAIWTRIMIQASALCGQTDGLTGPAAIAIPMLSLRLFANAFRGGPGSLNAAASQLESMLGCIQKFISSSKKDVRLSVATLLYNISFYLYSTKDTAPRPDIGVQIMTCVNTILDARTFESEAITRALIAVGTIALASPEAKEAAKEMCIISKVEMCASPHGDVAKAVAKEVYNVLA